jgi:hypothetical protein
MGWVIELSAAMSPVLEYDSILSQTDVDCSNQVGSCGRDAPWLSHG